jgi:hypothetical protein
MSYNTIPETWINVGKAIKRRLFTYIKNNFDNHEGRINQLETNAQKVNVFNFEVMGYINDYTAYELTGIATYEAINPFNLTEARLILMNSPSSPNTSTSGSLEIVLEKSVDGGITWYNVLATVVSIPDGENTTGYISEAAEFLDGEELINTGDIIRVNVVSKKDVQGSFLIQVHGEATI